MIGQGTGRIEKFSLKDLAQLRTELSRSELDSWQAAEVLSSFLAGRGYGVSAQRARDAVLRFEGGHSDLDSIQRELEGLAFVM